MDNASVRDCDAGSIDLTVYSVAEKPQAFEGLRTAGNRFVTVASIAAGLLIFWMLIGLFVAHRAGRI